MTPSSAAPRPGPAGPPAARLAGLLRLPWSFRRQIVVLTAAVTGVAMLLLSLVLQVVLSRITDSDADRVLEDRADAAVSTVQAGSTRGSGSEVAVRDADLDPGVVVFDAGGTVVAGRAPRRLTDAYADLSGTTTTRLVDARDDTRLRAQPFAVAGGARGVVVVAERLEPYEEAESLALVVSLVTGALATAAAAAIAAWTVRRALQPVAEMAATAADWSEHDLGRRFDLGEPANEISSLAQTLDTLLDKVSAAIRSEQRLTAELAHELRTPLTSIQGSAELVLLREGPRLSDDARADLVEITAAVRRMAGTITTLLDLARSGTGVAAAATTCLLPEVVAEVVAGSDHGSVALTVAVTSRDPGAVRLGLPLALAVRTLSPVVDNALHFATSTVTIASAVVGRMVEITVSDDGPGVDPAIATDVFEPGRTSGSSNGAGLGLAMSRRIARTAGGDVEVGDVASGTGGRFVVRLPLA